MQQDDNETLDLTKAEQAEVDAENNKDADAATAAAAEAKAADDAAAAAAAAEPKPDSADAMARAAEALGRTAEAVTALAQRAAPAAEAKDEPAKEPDWDAQRTALKQRLEKGEIDDDQYDDEREKLLEAKAEWRAQKIVAESTQRTNEQMEQAQWQRSLAKFATEPTNAEFLTSPVRKAALSSAVQTVAAESPHLSYDEILTQARDRVLKEFGQVPNRETDEQKALRIKKETAARGKAAGKAPTDLNTVPAGGGGDDRRAGKYADLDSMPVNELEDHLAHLKDDAIDDFLASAPGGLKDNPRAG